MSLQDDCNDHKNAITPCANDYLAKLRAAYADAVASGASINTKIAAQVQYNYLKQAVQNTCNAFENMANSVPGVTVQSSPGPKDNTAL